VVGFQQQNGLYADGQIGTDTWVALLRATPVPVQWGARATTSRARAIAARPGGASAPLSAGIPAVRDELGSGQAR
jgi:peptidoglycan hydrolase-like protein with peptidoglycan-binding domain